MSAAEIEKNNTDEGFDRPKLEPKGHAYRLTESWRTNCKGVLGETYVVVPKGFVTDGASIPRCLWPICGSPMDNPRIYAAIVHDYMYSLGGSNIACDTNISTGDENSAGVIYCSRKDADKLYRDYNIKLGMAHWKAEIEYHAIRLFGGGHWEGEK